MFTIPEPSPSSWPRIEPIEPIVTAGNIAPTPSPSSDEAPARAPVVGLGRQLGEREQTPSAITISAGTPNARGCHRFAKRPTSGDTSIAVTATGVIASAASSSE